MTKTRPSDPISTTTSELPFKSFLFPLDHHLVLTTRNQILCWDAQGVDTTFRSSSGGILATKEFKDGGDKIAIADSQVILIHDYKGGYSKTHRLKGSDDQIRLLKYAKNLRCLFFTTSLQNAVQRYSVGESRILDPAHTHPSLPTVLAISSTCHLLLSASANPPVIYLQNLTHETSPLLLHPTASATPISVAVFHPERPNLFLLGFADGTIAAYNASKIFRDDSTKPSAEFAKSGRTGEISHLKGLHRVITLQDTKENSIRDTHGLEIPDGTSWSESITAAAFMPGHMTRAVSVGADGKCRLIDFLGSGSILRTWKIKAPATSLSILALKPSTETQHRLQCESPGIPFRKQTRAGSRKSADDAGAVLANNIIAIGRLDGKVSLFDSVGLLLAEKDFGLHADRVCDVEWIEGSASKSLPQRQSSRGSPCGTKRKHPDAWVDGTLSQDTGESTVKRRFTSQTVEDKNFVQPTTYMDLFSPVKGSLTRGPKLQDDDREMTTTLEEERLQRQQSNSLQLNVVSIPARFPSSSPKSSEDVGNLDPNITSCSPKASHRSYRRIAPSTATTSSSLDSSQSTYSQSSGQSNEHANVLADLKRLGGQDLNKKNAISLFAPYMKPLPKPAASNNTLEADIWLDSTSPAKTSHSHCPPPPPRSALRQMANSSRLAAPIHQAPDSFIDGPRGNASHPSSEQREDHPTNPSASFASSNGPAISSTGHSSQASVPHADAEAKDPRDVVDTETPITIPSGLGRSRRSSFGAVIEFLSPKRRRERAAEQEHAREGEERRCPKRKARRTQQSVEEAPKEKARKALGNLVVNEVQGRARTSRLDAEQTADMIPMPGDSQLKLEPGVVAKSTEKQQLKNKVGGTQAGHQCHCTECPELKRQLEELRDEMAQLREMLS